VVGDFLSQEALESQASAWVLQIVLSILDHMALAGEVVEIEDSDPHRWSLT
jgi:hypothetical protein